MRMQASLAEAPKMLRSPANVAIGASQYPYGAWSKPDFNPEAPSLGPQNPPKAQSINPNSITVDDQGASTDSKNSRTAGVDACSRISYACQHRVEYCGMLLQSPKFLIVRLVHQDYPV